MNEHGIEPRGENTPLTIDSGYLPGFTHARQPQARVVTELLDHKLWLGLSLENPQTVFKAIGFPAATGFPSGGNGMALPGGGFVNINNPGGSGFTSSVEYSSNAAPDIV